MSELMDPSEWLAEAQATDVGQRRKIKHLCGDPSLVVYNNIDSWTAWCWRCHTRGWVPKPEANMRERLARKAKQEELDNAISYQVAAPFPACFDFASWPVAARLWLYKAGLTAGMVKQLGAYYHEPTGRVVLPVSEDGSTIFWQARNVEYPIAGGAKYISCAIPRTRVHCRYPQTDRGCVVLTEDILSAFKVGLSGAGQGYAVMGTVLGTHTLSYLVGTGATVYTWLDPDEAGDSARSTFRKQLSLYGIEAQHIVTEHDPKHYCLADIRRTIDVHRSHAATDHEGSQALLPVATPSESQGS